MAAFMEIVTVLMSTFVLALAMRAFAKRRRFDKFDLTTPGGKLAAMEWLSGGIEEKFEGVNLIVCSKPSPQEAIIYDFSEYEETKVVMLIAAGPESQEGMSAYENQTIYRFKDGSHIWAEGELYEADCEI